MLSLLNPIYAAASAAHAEQNKINKLELIFNNGREENRARQGLIAQISVNTNYTYWPKEQEPFWRLLRRCMISQRAPVTSPWLTGTRWAHRIHPVWLPLSPPRGRLTTLPLKHGSHCSVLNTNEDKYGFTWMAEIYRHWINCCCQLPSPVFIILFKFWSPFNIYIYKHCDADTLACATKTASWPVFLGLHPNVTAMHCTCKESAWQRHLCDSPSLRLAVIMKGSKIPILTESCNLLEYNAL